MSDLDDLEDLATIGMPSLRHNAYRYSYRLGDKSRRVTHCRRGHAMTPDNVYEYTKNGHTYRNCKKCQKLRLICRAEKKQDDARVITSADQSAVLSPDTKQTEPHTQ